MKTYKCWGIIYGMKNNNTEEITIEMKCNSKKEFIEECKKQGHKLIRECHGSMQWQSHFAEHFTVSTNKTIH